MYPFSLAKTRAQISASQRSKGKEPAAPKATRPAVARAASFIVTQAKKPRPVFTSLKHIYTTEGLAALYAGLGGEVLKGFLGHGMPMLLTERIHVVVVAAYFLALRAGRRSREGSRGLREDVAEEMTRVARAVGEVMESAGEKAVGSQ